MSKGEKKRRRRWWLIIPMWFFAVLIILLSISVLYLKSNSGRQFLTNQATSLLNQYVFHKIELGDIHYQFPLKFSISNLVIYDHKDSVLASVQTLVIDPKVRPILDSNIVVNNLVLSHFKVNLNKYFGDDDYNYTYAIKEQEQKNDQTKPWLKSFFVQKLILEEGDFRHNDYTSEPFVEEGLAGIDYYRLNARHLNAVFDSVSYVDSFTAQIKSLKLIETSGFYLQNLQADFSLGSHNFTFMNTKIKTPLTNVSADIDFIFDSWSEWKNFNQKVWLNIDLKESNLAFNDLRYFAPKLYQPQDEVQISGLYKGLISNFKVTDLVLKSNNHAYIMADVELNGLPNWKETFLDIKLKKSLISATDIQKILPQAELPKELSAFGDIASNGTFVGYASSFVAYGFFNTSIGSIKSDIRLQLSDEINSTYKGSIAVNQLNLKTLLNDENFGLATANATVDGKGLSIEHLKAALKGSINRFDYNNYSYADAQINGTISEAFFTGEFEIKDPNADFDFNGTVNFKAKKPAYRFKSKIQNLDLLALNLWQDTLIVKGILDVNFNASTAEDLEGNVSAKRLRVNTGNKRYNLDDLQLVATDGKKAKVWRLNSEIADAYLKTNTLLVDVAKALHQEGAHLLNNRKLKSKYINDSAEVDFNITLKNSDLLSSMLDDQLSIANNTKIVGIISHIKDTVFVGVDAPSIRYQDISLKKINTSISGKIDSVSGNLTLAKVQHNDSTWFKDYTLKFISNRKQITTHQTISTNDDLVYLELNNRLDLIANDSNQIWADSSFVLLDSTRFDIAWEHLYWIGPKRFQFANAALSTNNQKVLVSGYAEPESGFDITAQFEQVSTANFSGFLPDYLSVLQGNIRGNAHLYQINKNTIVELDAGIDSIEFRGVDLSFAQFATKYNSENKLLSIFSTLNRTDSSIIAKAKGGISYQDDQKINLDVNLNNLDVSLVDTLVYDIVNDLKGTANGRLSFGGTLKDPVVKGGLKLDSTSFVVNYLQTRYLLNDTFIIDKDKINFNKVKLYDVKSHTSVLDGKIWHNGFSSFDLDLILKSTNFQMLNTTEVDNELFYGSAYATGISKFNGPLLNINMNFDLKPEKGSKVFLPIEEDQGYTQQRFIRFVDHSEKKQNTYVVEGEGFAFEMNLDLNENAELQLIFDKQLGDIIKATGNGKLKLTLSETGEFEMFGDYIIEQGSYLFTAFDLINKRFSIDKGSKVSWVGSPYDALIDIRAAYLLKANAYYLVSALNQFDEAQLEQFNKPIPVKAIADLKGSLIKPEIKLSFKFQEDGTVDVNALERELNALNLNQEEIDKQVVSLLVLNRFMPIYTGPTNNPDLFGSGINSGLGDLISNQVTYWLSSISDNVQVDFKYRGEYTGDEGIVLTERELELALSASFLNDRIGVNYSYEFQQGYRPNTEITYRMTKDGSTKLKIFNRRSQNPVISQDSKTYGVGFFIKREFNSFKDLFKSKDKKIKD